MLEQLNLLNGLTSADNSATFATSIKSSGEFGLENSTQTQQFKQAEALSFNKFFAESLQVKEGANEAPVNKNFPELASNIKQLIKKIDNMLDQTAEVNKSPSAKGANGILDGSVQTLDESVQTLDESVQTLDEIEQIVEQLQQLMAELDEIKDDNTLESEMGNMKELVVLERQQVLELGELKNTLTEQIEQLSRKNDKALDVEEQLLLADLKALQKSVSSQQPQFDKITEQLNKIVGQHSQVKFNDNESGFSLERLREQLVKLDELSNNKSNLYGEVIGDKHDELSNQRSVGVKLAELSGKLSQVIEQISKAQHQQSGILDRGQSDNYQAKVETKQVAQQILSTIEGSKASLPSLVGEKTVATSERVLSDKTTQVHKEWMVSDKQNEKAIIEKTAVATSAVEHDYTELTNELHKNQPVASKSDNLVTQLESAFRQTNLQGTSNETATIPVNRIEQAISKDVNAQMSTAQKASEFIAPRITLNEHGVATQQLKEHMTMMARGGIGHAVIKLDPEELGAMSIRITMQQEQMNVQFQVSNPQAKDMLEQAMAKLRDALQEQGIALNQSDVKEQNQQQGHSHQATDEQLELSDGEFENGDVEPVTLVLNKHSANGIDYYA